MTSIQQATLIILMDEVASVVETEDCTCDDRDPPPGVEEGPCPQCRLKAAFHAMKEHFPILNDPDQET